MNIRLNNLLQDSLDIAFTNARLMWLALVQPICMSYDRFHPVYGTQSTPQTILIILIFLFLCLPLRIEAGPGTTNFPMIRVGAGARPMGMAGSFVALADDSNANLWNPAGLTQFNWPELSLTHMIYWQGITEETLVGTYPITEDLRIGTGIQLINYGDIPKTVEKADGSFDVGGSTGSFNPKDYLVGISTAYRLFDWMRIGVTGKYISSTIDDDKLDTFMGDLGLLFKFMSNPLPGMNQLTFGFSYQNYGSKARDYQMPQIIRAGLAAQWQIIWPRDLVTSLEIDYPMDTRNTKTLVGAEYWIADVVAIRSGYKQGYDIGNLYFGAGVQLVYSGTGYQIDYAFEPATVFGSTHRITLTLRFSDEYTE